MKFAAYLTLIGLTQIALGLLSPLFAPLAGLLIWSGLSWVAVGVAYSANAAWIFGKGADGAMSGVSVALLLPYLVVTWLLWHLQNVRSDEPTHKEIVGSMWLGRRCGAAELPPNIRTVVDLTSEFPEPGAVRAGREYHCLPTLDASSPSLPSFQALLLVVVRSPEPIYIHCAKGHGRSAMVVIALLLARNLATTVSDAERIAKQARPGVQISTHQRRLLERWWAATVTA